LTRRLMMTLGFGAICAMAAPTGGAVPRPAPEYVIKLTTGQQILLSSYRGKVVALLFVMTTCPHCQTTCQLMSKFAREYGPRGFQPVAVAFNDMSMMLLPDFIKQNRLDFPVGYDSREPVFNFIERSPTLRSYVPMLVFIDRNGTIRAQHLGDDDFFTKQEPNFRAMIEKLLSEPVGKKHPAKRVASKVKKSS